MPRREDHSGPAFIPAAVLHDSDLSAQAKLLAGRILTLTRREGFCWASNEYLADDLGANRRTLERWIKELRDSPHFHFKYDKSKDGTTRRIYPVAPPRKSAGWGYADMSSAPRKSVDQVVEVEEKQQKRPRTRENGKPIGPGDVHELDINCPECDEPLYPNPNGPFCTRCAKWFPTEA